MIIVLATALLLFTVCSGLCSASETAFFSLPGTKTALYRKETDKRKRLVASLIENPHDLLVTILILNIFANIVVQNIASDLFAHSHGWLLKVGVPLILTLVFGEILPKSIALSNNESICLTIAPSVKRTKKLLKPIRNLITPIAMRLSHFVCSWLNKPEQISKEELQHVLVTSKARGILTHQEAQLMQGYLNLQETNIKGLMQPREEIEFYCQDSSLEEIERFFTESNQQQVIICKEGLDKIEGLLSAQDFFTYRNTLQSYQDLLPLLEKPFFIPETTAAKTLLKNFEERMGSFALVVDEYGSVCGTITKPDLLEVIIGKILTNKGPQEYHTLGDKDCIVTSGKLELTEFEKIFHSSLTSQWGMVTVGGWLTEQLSEIPQSGTKHLFGNFFFHILDASPSRIKRLYIRKIKQ